MNIRTIRQCCALVWALLLTFILALPLKAVETPLATPPASAYLDTESAVTLPFEGWNDLTRIFKIRFELDFASPVEQASSPAQLEDSSTSIRGGEDASSTNASNCCIQVALGRDANADGNLAPEETDLVLGYDCGEWVVRDERFVEQASSPAQLEEFSTSIRGGGDASSTSATFTIPRQLFDRTWNAAKVTTRGAHGVSALPSPFAGSTITLIFKNTPFVIRIR